MSDKLKINKSYAENYNKWRQKEELAKLKDKYSGSVSSSDSDNDSSSESEDDDAEGLTEGIERDWMKTLAALKNKDPIIYQKDAHFYNEEESSSSEEGEKKKKKKKDKPIYLKDYERKVITEKGGLIDEESDAEQPHTSKSYYEEQDEIRKNLLVAAADSDEASGDELIKTKHKAKTKQVEGPSVQQKRGNKQEPLKSYWNNPSLDEGEKFLRDYILKKKYIDKDEDNNFKESDHEEEEEGFSEEEELLVKQETFERKYNFRFEEPDADQIQTYPRSLEDTVRRKDTKRAEKRQKAKERKQKEKDLKKEELKQLKNLKKQEILAKIDQLREITGNKDLQFDPDDLDKDFDPAEHDRMMQAQFGDDFYDMGDDEDVKPIFDDLSGDEFDEGKWDDWQGPDEDADYYEPHVDDPDFNMDADYDPTVVPKKSKKKKKKNKLAQALEAKKPVYNPSEKTFEEYLDEYYKLDYEDIIDGMPCRFKYRKTVANDYGLSAEEILGAREKELNAWASLKKMSQYRSKQEEMHDVQVYTRKGKNFNKKKNVLPSLFTPKEEENEEASTDTGKKKNKDNAEETKSPDKSNNKHSVTATVTSESLTKKEKKKKNKLKRSLETGDIPVKKQKLDLDMTEESEIGNENDSLVNTASDVAREILKKKKNKKNKAKNASQINENKQQSVGEGNESKQQTESETKSDKRTNETNDLTGSNEISEANVKKRKKRKKKKSNEEKKVKMSDERLKAYGINPKKYKYMSKEELFQFKNKDDQY